MSLNLQTRAGSSVDDSLILELLDGERFEELERYINQNMQQLPLVNYAVYGYLSKNIYNGGMEKAMRIVNFGKEKGYQWELWRFD